VSLKRVNYIKDMEWDKIIDEKNRSCPMISPTVGGSNPIYLYT
jgi:hypothetical protein